MPSFIVVKGRKDEYKSTSQRIYTVVQCLPVEADGRLRYRIKSEKFERVVTEDELSYSQ